MSVDKAADAAADWAFAVSERRAVSVLPRNGGRMSKRKANIAGATSSAATGAALYGSTALLSGPAANLGGYAVAQIAASSVGAGGPALSVAIAAVGGPVVVGAAIAAGVGVGVYLLVRRLGR